MSTAKLSAKSQLVLPAEVRRKLGIRPGDRLIIDVEGDHATLRKATRSDVETLAGFRSELWRDYDAELRKARDEWDS